MPRIRDLGGIDWQFGPVTRRPFDAPNVDDRADVTKWLPAWRERLVRWLADVALR